MFKLVKLLYVGNKKRLQFTANKLYYTNVRAHKVKKYRYQATKQKEQSKLKRQKTRL